MNLIVLGLSLLTGLTGFSSGASYQTTSEHLIDALTENGIILNEEDHIDAAIERYGDIYNLSGQNRNLGRISIGELNLIHSI